jgi:hypothetical protein
MVRAPQTDCVISTLLSGEPQEDGQPIELTVSPQRWPETGAYCTIPWAGLESTLGATDKR